VTEEQQEEGLGVNRRGAALPEGRVAAGRGENARQLIRRAKRATPQEIFLPEEKIRIVM